MKPVRTADLTHAAPLDAGAGAHRRRSCCSMSAACVEACGATMTGGKEKAAPVSGFPDVIAPSTRRRRRILLRYRSRRQDTGRSTVMGRHERRASVAVFRREVARSDLITFLAEADDLPLDQPRLSHALAFWNDNIQQRKPYCPACRSNFSDEALPGAFLLTTPSSSGRHHRSAYRRSAPRAGIVCRSAR
jgi:hypothetical protein